MAKILILYASIGQGHKTASLALQESFESLGEHEVVVEDILDYALPVFKSIYSDSYLDLIEKAPDFMSLLYRLSDKANSDFSKELVSLYSRLGVPRFHRHEEKGTPDAVIITHHLGVNLIKQIMSSKEDLKVYSVITDYTTTSIDAHKKIAGYFVANTIVRDLLIKRGIDKKIIEVTGIPIKKIAQEPKDQTEVRKKLGFTKFPVVTICGSGIRDSKISTIIEDLNNTFKGTVVVVAGRNILLQEKMEEMEGNDDLDLIKYNKVDFMDDLLVASDVLVTKAGGLIISEALGRGVPMVLVNGIRGHEEWNADYVTMEGAGVQIHTPELLATAVNSICENPERKKYMALRAKEMGQPEASKVIAQKILQEISSS